MPQKARYTPRAPLMVVREAEDGEHTEAGDMYLASFLLTCVIFGGATTANELIPRAEGPGCQSKVLKPSGSGFTGRETEPMSFVWRLVLVSAGE